MPTNLRKGIGLGFSPAPGHLIPEHIECAVTGVIGLHTPIEGILLGLVIHHLILLIGAHQEADFEGVSAECLLKVIPYNIELLVIVPWCLRP